MTRRESLLALGFAFLLFAAGLTWLLGAYGLILSAVLLVVATGFFVRVEDQRRGESVADAVPDQILAALERDLSL